MNNGYYYQLLINLSQESQNLNLSRGLKEQLLKGDVENVNQLLQSLGEDVSGRPVTDERSASQFVFFAEQGLLFSLYRGDFDSFFQFHTLLGPRLEEMGELESDTFSAESWKHYFDYLNLAAKRLIRHESLETFETFLDEEVDWESFSGKLMPRVSGITGYVYLNERNRELARKGRFWTQKAASEAESQFGIVYYLDLARFFFAEGTQDSLRHIENIIGKLEVMAGSTGDLLISRLYNAAVFELQALALLNKFRMFDDSQVKIEYNLESLRDLEYQMKGEAKDNGLPSFSLAYLQMEFARHYSRLAAMDSFEEQRSLLLAMANDNSAGAIRIARNASDDVCEKNYTLLRYRMLASSDPNLSEKDFRDLVNELKKSDNLLLAVNAVSSWADYQWEMGETQKAYKSLSELMRNGMKKSDDGGIELVISGIEIINRRFFDLTHRPGISWLISEQDSEKRTPLEIYFAQVRDVIDSLEDQLESLGRVRFDRLRVAYIEFEPISHYNLKVFLQYRWYELKLTRLNAILSGDKIGLLMMDNALHEFEHENNPFSFIKADWDEFKDIPNSVRNKVLNKCISITKGDLPAAAEHLDFSYRNLRSYITFNEVNRLGWFLDERETNNRKLEQGIRLMFHDLYKSGTIFEVVFDMPKFLVDYGDGFSSQDLEESLSIKGTTAKKYIKIMMEIDLINHEKSIGRKHFYKLRKDNVMNRLGKTAKVLAQG